MSNDESFKGKCPTCGQVSGVAPEARDIKDAARYRWFRSLDANLQFIFAEPLKYDAGAWGRLGSRYVLDKLDAIIDAAIKDQPVSPAALDSEGKK